MSETTKAAATGSSPDPVTPETETPKTETPKSETAAPAPVGPDAGTASVSASASGGKGRLLLTTAVGGVLVVLAGWATLPWWSASLPAPLQSVAQRILPSAPATPVTAEGTSGESTGEITGETAALRADVDDLRATVAHLQQQLEDTRMMVTGLGPSDGVPAVPAASAERLAALEAMVADLAEKSPATVAADLRSLSGRVEELAASRAPASALLTLGDRVTEVEALARKMVSRQDRAVALLLSVVQLREAVDSGRTFSVALKTVQAIAPAELDVKALTADFAVYAEDGLMTDSELERMLSERAAGIVRAAVLPEEATPWWSQALSQLASLVSVRRVDGLADSDDVASIVTRAQTAMGEGSLAVAVDELSRLTGRPAQEADLWLQQARARLGASVVISDLVNEGLARLAAESAAPVSASPASASPASASPASGG